MNYQEKSNWILYIAGSSVSQFGSLIFTFAVGLYVLDKTGSSTQFATTLVMALLPNLLLSPFAGFIADRFNRKTIVVVTDVLNGLLFIMFFLMTTIIEVSIPMTYAVLLITNIFSSFFGIAFESAKAQLVSDNNLTSINSVSQIIMAAAHIMSPMIGGLVYGWIGLQQFMLLNGISFLLSALSEVFIDFEFNKSQLSGDNERVTNIIAATREAIRYLVTSKHLLYMMFFFFICNLALSIGIQVPMPYILYNHFGVDASLYGLLSATFPIGLIIGAILIKPLVARVELKTIIHCGGFIIGFIIMIIGLPYFVDIPEEISVVAIYYGFSSFVCGIGIAFIDVPISTIFQQSVESHYRGRIMGIFRPIIKVANPVGFIFSGYLLSGLDPLLVPLLTGVLFVIVFLGYLFVQQDTNTRTIEVSDVV